jgi:hypothetical protein
MRIASAHYASISASLQKAQPVKPNEYRKMKIQAEVARGVCLMTKDALNVHKVGHKKKK